MLRNLLPLPIVEGPVFVQRFGEPPYEAYRRNVPCWNPRPDPCRPAPPG